MIALFRRDGPLRWAVWQLIGVCIALCAVMVQWLLIRQVDLSLLNPAQYSDFGWLLLVAWHSFWVWFWVIE